MGSPSWRQRPSPCRIHQHHAIYLDAEEYRDLGDWRCDRPALTAAGIALYKDDKMGLGLLTVETLLTVGTAYALKNVVHEERPNGTDDQSLPPAPTRLHLPDRPFCGAAIAGNMSFPRSRSVSSSPTAASRQGSTIGTTRWPVPASLRVMDMS